MNQKTEKLIEVERKNKLIHILKSEWSEFENIDICIALEKFISELEGIEV